MCWRSSDDTLITLLKFQQYTYHCVKGAVIYLSLYQRSSDTSGTDLKTYVPDFKID